MIVFLESFFGSLFGLTAGVMLWGFADFFINGGMKRFVLPWLVRRRHGVYRGYVIVRIYWRDHAP